MAAAASTVKTDDAMENENSAILEAQGSHNYKSHLADKGTIDNFKRNIHSARNQISNEWKSPTNKILNGDKTFHSGSKIEIQGKVGAAGMTIRSPAANPTDHDVSDEDVLGLDSGATIKVSPRSHTSPLHNSQCCCGLPTSLSSSRSSHPCVSPRSSFCCRNHRHHLHHPCYHSHSRTLNIGGDYVDSSNYNGSSPSLDMETRVAKLTAEVEILKKLNEKLTSQLLDTQTELASVKEELKKRPYPGIITNKVNEIYRAQRERDEAMMARIHMANEERNDALLQLSQWREKLSSNWVLNAVTKEDISGQNNHTRDVEDHATSSHISELEDQMETVKTCYSLLRSFCQDDNWDASRLETPPSTHHPTRHWPEIPPEVSQRKPKLISTVEETF